MGKERDLMCLVRVALAASFMSLNAGAATYYVRGDGLGNNTYAGTNWATAYATIQKALDTVPYGAGNVINVQASTGAQVYATCSRVASGGGLSVSLQGGWQNVDSAPTQNLKSLIWSAAGNQAGIFLTGASGYSTALTVSGFTISNVTRGIHFYSDAANNWAGCAMTVNDCSIRAKNDGVYLDYQQGNPYDNYGGICRVTAINVDITAGLGGAGDGICSRGTWAGSSVTGVGLDAITGIQRISTITSSNGCGVRFVNMARDSRGCNAWFSNMVVFGSSSYGVALNPGPLVWWDAYGSPPGLRTNAYPVVGTFRNCTIADNGSNGVYSVVWDAGSSISVINTIFANNSGSGICLDSQGRGSVFGFSDDYNCFFNDDLYVNSGFRSPAAHDTAADPLFLTQKSKPEYYKLKYTRSPCYRRASDGGNIGAWQNTAGGSGFALTIK